MTHDPPRSAGGGRAGERKPDRPVAILYLDHHRSLAGGQHSLLALLRKLDRSRFAPVVATDDAAHRFQASLAALGIEVVKVPFNRRGYRAEYEGDLHRRPLRLLAESPGILRALVELGRILRSRDIRLIHANTYKTAALAGLAARPLGIPMIFRARSSLSYQGRGWIDRLVYAFSSRVLANSHFVARSFDRVDADVRRRTRKVATIYNPLDLERFSPDRPGSGTLKREFDIGASETTVGLIGRITRRKRQHVAVDAVHRLRERGRGVTLLLVGERGMGRDDEYARQVDRQVERLGMSGAVLETGYREPITSVLADLDVCVLPSVAEPLSRAVFEAQASGVPVVVTDSGGNPELVEHRKTGLLCAPDDPADLAKRLDELIQDPGLGQSLARCARSVTERRFSDAATVRREEALYARLTGRVRGGRPESARP